MLINTRLLRELHTDYKNYSSSSPNFVSLSEVELAIIGMSDSGFRGITYDARPRELTWKIIQQ